jgi:hypothetical protein
MARHRLRSASFDDCQKAFCRYYRDQIGGALPVFHGSDQYGDGLGDILRGVFRFLVPIAKSAASKFITSTSSGLDIGQSLGQAAKSAILPTIGEAVWNVGKEALARHKGMESADQHIRKWTPQLAPPPYDEKGPADQKGTGNRRRKRRRTATKKVSRKRRKSSKVTTRKRKRVYKGKPRAKRLRFLPTNF